MGTKVTSRWSVGSAFFARSVVVEPAEVGAKTMTTPNATGGGKTGGGSEEGRATMAGRIDPLHPPSPAPRTLSAGIMVMLMPDVTPTIIPVTSAGGTYFE